MLLQHSQNRFYYNPSAIGRVDYKVFTTALGLNNTANSYASTATLELPIINQKHALAIQINNNRRGYFAPVETNWNNVKDTVTETIFLKNINLLEVSILYSRKIYLGNENILHFGAQLNLERVDFIPVNTIENGTFPPDYVQKPIYRNTGPIYLPDLNLGVQFTKNNFYIGAAVKNLAQPYFIAAQVKNNNSGGYDIIAFTSPQYITAYFMAGNVFRLKEKTDLQTSILVATDADNMYASNLDINNTFIIELV